MNTNANIFTNAFVKVDIKKININRKNLVWLTKDKRDADTFTRLNISANICESYGLKSGDRVDFYAMPDNSAYALKKNDVGVFTVRKASNTSSPTMVIACRPLCNELRARSIDKNGNFPSEFSAMILGDLIVFKKVEE